MRKVLARLTIVSVLLFAVGFQAITVVHAQSKADIAVLLPDSQSSARWENDDRKFLSEAFDAAGVTYSITNAQGDPTTQVTQAEQAITNGAKVILLVDLDQGSGTTIIADGHAAGAKVIDYDRLTLQGGSDFYVSFDGTQVGVLQGQGLVAAVKAAGIKNPRIAILDGSPTDNNATLFSNGAHQILDPLFAKGDDSGTWTKVDEQAVTNWDNTVAQTDFEGMLSAHPNGIDGVLAANDGLAGAVIAALENNGLPYLPVTGQDATVGGIQNILAGKQSMTVYKGIKAEADAAAALAIALVKGDDTSKLATGKINNGTADEPAVLLTPVSVTKDNIADTVIADGFRTWAEICVGDFAQYCPPDAMATAEATMEATPEATASS